MKPPTELPLEYASELLLDLSMMRDECVNAARALASEQPLNERALEECARLDDAVAASLRILQSALKSIQELRKLESGGPPAGFGL